MAAADMWGNQENYVDEEEEDWIVERRKEGLGFVKGVDDEVLSIHPTRYILSLSLAKVRGN